MPTSTHIDEMEPCMPRVLKVNDRSFILRKAISIADGAGDPLYEVEGDFHWLSPTWRIRKREVEVASIRRVVLAMPAAWEVKGDLGAFRIERDLYSAVGGLWVNGGPFDKGEVRGRWFSDNLEISHQGHSLARTQMPLFVGSGRRFSVEVAEDDDRAELLTAIVMVTHHMDDDPGGLLGFFLG